MKEYIFTYGYFDHEDRTCSGYSKCQVFAKGIKDAKRRVEKFLAKENRLFDGNLESVKWIKTDKGLYLKVETKKKNELYIRPGRNKTKIFTCFIALCIAKQKQELVKVNLDFLLSNGISKPKK